MKRLLSLLLVVSMLMSMVVTTAVYAEEPDSNLPFTDVPADEWYTDAVEYVYANELMNGKSETKFAPKEALTRAQFVTTLYRLAGATSTEVDLDFKDIDVNFLLWYILAGVATGVIASLWAIRKHVNV